MVNNSISEAGLRGIAPGTSCWICDKTKNNRVDFVVWKAMFVIRWYFCHHNHSKTRNIIDFLCWACQVISLSKNVTAMACICISPLSSKWGWNMPTDLKVGRTCTNCYPAPVTYAQYRGHSTHVGHSLKVTENGVKKRKLSLKHVFFKYLLAIKPLWSSDGDAVPHALTTENS